MKIKTLLLSILFVITTTSLNSNGNVFIDKIKLHPSVKDIHRKKDINVKRTSSLKQKQETKKPVMMNARMEYYF